MKLVVYSLLLHHILSQDTCTYFWKITNYAIQIQDHFCVSHQEMPSKVEPLNEFLRETNWALAKPLFVGYLKRITAILSENHVTDHLSLSTDKSISLLTSLGNANVILHTLFKSSKQCDQLCLHRAVAEDPLFIKYSMDFICDMLKLSGTYVYMSYK